MGRKISVDLDEGLYKAVEAFRRENPKDDGSIRSRTWAVEALLRKGLVVKGTSG